MSDNAERFTGRVTEYARYRTRYPAAVVEWLRATCGLTPEWMVADVGAGTGMLAELFLENGNEVTAVEPNEEMRALCERLRERYARFRVVDGTAERTGLDVGSVELVSVGRALHWFEPVGAAAEFRRVIRPGGWVAIVSSGRSKEETEQARAFEDLLVKHGTDYAHVRDRYRRRERIDAFSNCSEVVIPLACSLRVRRRCGGRSSLDTRRVCRSRRSKVRRGMRECGLPLRSFLRGGA